jgi:putative ribosome biogenesis GTPase RsgA
VISIGDRVKFARLPDGSGVIEEIEPRHSELVRLDPTPKEPKANTPGQP